MRLRLCVVTVGKLCWELHRKKICGRIPARRGINTRKVPKATLRPDACEARQAQDGKCVHDVAYGSVHSRGQLHTQDHVALQVAPEDHGKQLFDQAVRDPTVIARRSGTRGAACTDGQTPLGDGQEIHAEVAALLDARQVRCREAQCQIYRPSHEVLYPVTVCILELKIEPRAGDGTRFGTSLAQLNTSRAVPKNKNKNKSNNNKQ